MNIQIETLTLADGSKVEAIRDVEKVKRLASMLEEGWVVEDGADMVREKLIPRKVLRKHRDYVGLLIYSHQNNDYPIERHRMNTAPKVLGWIQHLCGKPNVSTDHIEAFIDAAKEMGVPVDFNA